MAEIKPLLQDVADQIKSSAALPSLNHVIFGLLKNSLDAASRKISINVDFSKASCSVEDDGLGIAPADFEETGGLAKPYYTSKQEAKGVHGKYGTFLSAVSALSILSVTSKHRCHQLPCSIVFHHTRVAARLVPDSSNQLSSRPNGTTVSVQDLFGNMAVRVKQRPKDAEGSKSRDREWRLLCNTVTGLLLAWGRGISIKIQGADKGHKFQIRYFNPPLQEHTFNVPLIRSILSQTTFLDPNTLHGWVRTSAKAEHIKIDALFSPKPAPSKEMQFICYGVEYIDGSTGFNFFYEEANRVFNQSSFGSDENTISGKSNDGSNTPNSRRTKASTKGIDRWPMFVIWINPTLSHDETADIDSLAKSDTDISSILNILAAMIRKFLEDHNFRIYQRQSPLKAKMQRLGLDNHTNSRTDAGSKSDGPTERTSTSLQDTDQRPKTLGVTSHRFQREQNRTSPIEEAIRTGYYGGPVPIFCSKDTLIGNWKRDRSTNEDSTISRIQGSQNELEVEGDEPETQDHGGDKVISWKDQNGKVIRINSRTGNVITTLSNDSKSLRKGRVSRSLFLDKEKVQQLDGAALFDVQLSEIDNSVFKPSEEAITCSNLPEALLESMKAKSGFSSDPQGLSISGDFKSLAISKQDLQDSLIISQVDSKFILAKIPIRDASMIDDTTDDLLYLIDQHAADERVRVEELFTDLCSSPTDDNKNTSSSLGFKSSVRSVGLAQPIQFTAMPGESELFHRKASYFANWGILFDLTKPSHSKTARGSSSRKDREVSVRVTHLPPVIAERCRIEPKHLVNLIREITWESAKDGFDVAAPARPSSQTESTSWVSALHRCPRPIIDMINSRSCRSAIMFNDMLTQDQCEELVKKLSRCHFPFQCAHGRPSLVPMADLKNMGDFGVLDEYNKVNSLGLSEFKECWANFKATRRHQ